MHELLSFVWKNSVTMIWFVPCLQILLKTLSKICEEKYRYYMCLLPVIGFLLPIRCQVILPVRVMAGSGRISIPLDQAALNEGAAGKWISAIWLSGLLLFLMLSMVWHIRYMRMTGRWKREFGSGEAADRFANLKKKYGIAEQISLKLCPCIHTPMTVYLFYPEILLPSEAYSEEEFDMIISHELMHIRRRDIVYRTLLLLFLAVYWFHPLAYWLAREIQCLCETSCDEAVLKGADAGMRTRYIEILLRTAMGHDAETESALTMEFISTGKRLKRRIWSVRHVTRHRRYGIAMAIFAGIIICMGLTVRVECRAYADAAARLKSEGAGQESRDIRFTENERKGDADEAAGVPETDCKTDLVCACMGNGNTVTEIYDMSAFRNMQPAVNDHTFALAVEHKQEK